MFQPGTLCTLWNLQLKLFQWDSPSIKQLLLMLNMFLLGSLCMKGHLHLNKLQKGIKCMLKHQIKKMFLKGIKSIQSRQRCYYRYRWNSFNTFLTTQTFQARIYNKKRHQINLMSREGINGSLKFLTHYNLKIGRKCNCRKGFDFERE